MRQGVSDYKGVFKTVNKKPYGVYEYWIANVYVKGVRYIKRCASEEHAAIEYKKLCKKHGYVEPIKFD